MKPRIFSILAILLLITAPVLAIDEDLVIDADSWPKDIKLKKYTVTIYQPQTESFVNNDLESRAAFSVDIKGKPVFGAMWFSSRIVTDKEERMVYFEDLQIEDIKFPEEDQSKIEKFKSILNDRFSQHSLSMSLDRFLVDIEEFEERKGIDAEFNNAPPVVYFEKEPAVLVLIDGDPILQDIDNSNYKYVVNTPFFVLQDSKAGLYYLKGGKWWYTSKKVDNNWKAAESVPAEIQKIADEAFTDVEQETDSAVADLKSPPKVILSTEPAELIQTDGEPKFNPISETNLLFMENTESDIIMNINTQEYYVLISGRWYKSKSMDSGTWEYISSDELPEDFKNIPDDSEIANVRSSVAGTQEAKEAILENTIPQTAEVDRTTTVEVSFDGNPKFEKIEGSNLQFAENSDKTVLKDGDKYYCVDDGIWFEADEPTGPYRVSTVVPDGVEDIPPSSPVYNVKYVYVYDYTPSVVYVGYTPAYYGSYVYGGTVVYGTGFYYRPWYGAYYYPRPVTYGFGVHYNPWTGWGFSFGVSYGWMSFSFHSSAYRGWWGPGGYRYGYRHGYHRGYHHGYRRGYAHGYAAGRRAGYRHSYNRARPTPYSSNVYRNRTQGVRTAQTRQSTRQATGGRTSTRQSTTRQNYNNRASTGNRQTSTRPSTNTRQNNVYSDRSGNVYKRDNSGNWQQRSSSGSWQNSGNRSSNQNLNKTYQNRSRGTQRTQSYNRTRSASPSRSSGTRSRSGGGRRR